MQKVAETPWKVMERSGAFLSIQYLINPEPHGNPQPHGNRNSTRIILNRDLSLAISTITDREINEL
jgi:hypothetical protein